MKNISSLLILFIACIFMANAQEQITTLNNQTYTGFIFEENNTFISLTDINNVDITIGKQNISIRKKVFANIYTKSGKKYNGTLTKSSNLYMEFVDNTGSKIKVAKADIDSIEIDGKSIGLSNIKLVNSPSYRTNYPSVGILIGTPGVFNLVFSSDFSNNFGIRLCGGGLSQYTAGGEFNVLYSLYKSPTFDSHVYLSAGLLKIEEKEVAMNYEYQFARRWNYFGFGTDINFRGFFLQLGLSFGSGDFTSPQVMGGIGYVYRFND